MSSGCGPAECAPWACSRATSPRCSERSRRQLRSGGRAAGVLAAGVRGQRIRGAVDELRLDNGRLRISGWCRDPETPHDAVELSTPADGPAGTPFGTLAVTEPAADGAFEVECEAPLADSPVGAPRRVGVLRRATRSARCRPTGLPACGGSRCSGLTVAHDLLDPLGHYRALDSFESALDLDSGLEPSLASLVPNARVSSAPDDGGFDLVTGHAVDIDEARVAELQRVTRPGAYVALERPGRACAPVRGAGRSGGTN